MADVDVEGELKVNDTGIKAILREDDGASYLCLPLDHFKIGGPNGEHCCFVYPVLGPHMPRGLGPPPQETDQSRRRICLKLVKAINFLHRKSICHGGKRTLNLVRCLAYSMPTVVKT